MTHNIYSHQQLQLKSIARLKQIYSEIGCTVEVQDKRCKDAWMNAIAQYQASKLEKVAPAAPNEQATAQAETVALKELTPVEISFYDHEYYCGDKLVAAITYDHADFVTQPWLVIVNDKEIHRADTWAKCHNFITWHHKDGTLPVQQEALVQGTLSMGENIFPLHPAPCPLSSSTTGNEIMSQIFNECEKFGFEILDDGIYRNYEKLGEIGQTNGNWWFIRAEDETQQRISCDSALDAVWWLSMVDVSLASESADEYLQYRPLEQMTGDELQRLLEKAELVAA
ncbi:hypothetical protein FNW02_35400 [Komarekiella sp. 'clone 1']|uniref:Uncharacterized protein n=1 Tax=Komarekiella delphini-convector SJRDD-AB1 TaxID=2593771 RepID=A0AA40VV67_9NOST|nr:hypothetical protein [Komarekiella delphini-convector]MBD6620880.1 hypothetical protein [Komarekiella delphini-convector SJRDD-AB1]